MILMKSMCRILFRISYNLFPGTRIVHKIRIRHHMQHTFPKRMDQPSQIDAGLGKLRHKCNYGRVTEKGQRSRMVRQKKVCHSSMFTDCNAESSESCLCLFRDPGCLDLTNICGFILNVPSEYKFGFVMLPLRRRHWITLRQIHGNFYNLDSKLEAPVLIGRVSFQHFSFYILYNIDVIMYFLGLRFDILSERAIAM